MNAIDRLKNRILVDGYHHIFDFDKSHDSWLYDSGEKKEYLDCFGQFGSMALGYNHPSLVKVQAEISKVSLSKIVNSDIYSEQYADFAEALFSTVGADFKYLFVIEGGSAAIENALKVAFDYKAKKIGLTDKEAQNLDIIHLKQAFHGRGGYTLSLTNTGNNKTDFFPRWPWTRILNPKVLDSIPPDEIKENERFSLDHAEIALRKGNVAAIILEILQSEGGNNIFSKEYISGLKDLSDKYDCLLIFDEVQTGLGASGHWWLYQHYNIIPDILVFGKKVQVCGMLASGTKLDTISNHCFKESGRINSTFGGSIIDMVRATNIINIIEEEHLLDNVRDVGDYLLNNIKELEKSLPIINTRGIGSLIAFDLETTDKRSEALAKLKNNMIILPCGEKSIRFRPALTFSKPDADAAMNILKTSL